MRKHILKLIFVLILLFTSCGPNYRNVHNLYKVDNPNYITYIRVYWASGYYDNYDIYSKDTIYTCSYQGTNFVLEKNNEHEIYSSTAPIKILESIKLNNNYDR